eukprot:1702058-Pyramimonas_sp.AAC.1
MTLASLDHTLSHGITWGSHRLIPMRTWESHHPRLPTNLQYAYVHIYNDTARKIRARDAKNVRQKSAVLWSKKRMCTKIRSNLLGKIPQTQDPRPNKAST